MGKIPQKFCCDVEGCGSPQLTNSEAISRNWYEVSLGPSGERCIVISKFGNLPGTVDKNYTTQQACNQAHAMALADDWLINL